MASPGHSSNTTEEPPLLTGTEKDRVLKHFPPYGGVDEKSTGDTCPTCHGTGRIPRGQEDQLVAVIPCNDARLKPRRTLLYVIISMVVCLFLCCLILFFLFPRTVTMTPVSLLSAMVLFTPSTLEMQVTNLINVNNPNYASIRLIELSIQALVEDVVVGKTKVNDLGTVNSQSNKSYAIQTNMFIEDFGLIGYCNSSSIVIRKLFVSLQLTMNISYFSHMEQLSQDCFEYVDCGANSTIPHPIRL